MQMTPRAMKWTGIALLVAWLWAELGLWMGLWLILALWLLIVGWVKEREEG